MKGFAKSLGLSVLAVSVMAQNALAVGIFPVDTASAADIVLIKADIVAWGVVFLSVALSVYAYRRIKSLVR